MNIYLDIDGVIITNEGRLAIGAKEFIKYASDYFTVYWLTTHCMHGDGTPAIKYINRASDEDLSKWLSRFKPTIWSLKKTDAINFSQPFLWFDDDCFIAERLELKAKGALNSWIEIDLHKYSDQLKHELQLLKSIRPTT